MSSTFTYEEDKALVRRVVRGDERAFREFFDHYYPRVYRFCTRRLDGPAAEDVAQTVMVQATRKLASYRGEAALFTWLGQIARNEISSHYRSNARHRHLVAMDDNEQVRAEVESLAADPLLNPDNQVQQHQRQAMVGLILDHLPGQYGNVLEWKYIEGLSVAEIAERMNTSVTAVQSMLARARKAFQQQFQTLAVEVRELPFELSAVENKP